MSPWVQNQWVKLRKLHWNGKLGSLVCHASNPEILGIVIDYMAEEESRVLVKWFCDAYAEIPQEEDIFFLKVLSK